MNPRAKLQDVALAAGVAVSTVSGILNSRSDSWASAETKKRVFEAARKLGYTPNRLARSLRLQHNSLALLVVPDLLNPFFAGLAREVTQAMESRGYEVTLEETEFKPEREARILNEVASRHVDGLIGVFARPASHVEILKKISVSFPVVVFGSPMATTQVDTLESDIRASLGEAIAHLRELGHRSVGFVDPLLGFDDPLARVHFFSDFAEHSGMQTTADWMIRCTSDLGHIRTTVSDWASHTRAGDRPTALFCMNDLTAIATIRGLKDAGLSVPRDISVIGFDNIALGAFLECPLTTIAQPLETMGQMATEILVNRISRQRVGPATHLTMPTRLIIRSSTGRAASS